jgi:hypothetical protein
MPRRGLNAMAYDFFCQSLIRKCISFLWGIWKLALNVVMLEPITHYWGRLETHQCFILISHNRLLAANVFHDMFFYLKFEFA